MRFSRDPLPFALLLGFFLAACGPLDESPRAVFEQLRSEFHAFYGPREQRGIDLDDLFHRHAPRFEGVLDDEALFVALTEMLSEFDDGHVHLSAPGRRWWFSNRIYRERIGFDRFDRDLIEETYLAGEYEIGKWHEYTLGRLPARGPAYLHLTRTSDNLRVLPEARALAEEAGGLILDLRHNGGGDFTWAFGELADWTDRDHPVFRSRTRNGPELGDFDPWFDWAIEGEGTPVDFPIYVLTDRFTISAGERLVMALRTFDDVTFLGEPTNGAISTMIGRELPNAWYFDLPTQEVEDALGEVWEGVGLPVDFEVINDPVEMAAGHDAVLDAALTLWETP